MFESNVPFKYNEYFDLDYLVNSNYIIFQKNNQLSIHYDT
jgi:hypothetical protein